MPKTKKASSSSDSSSDSGPEDRTPSKKAKTSTSASAAPPKKDDDEEKTWVLEKLRMVKLREFRGREMIDIREYYDANGEIKPGKKGICLSVTQWKKLCSFVDEINKEIKS